MRYQATTESIQTVTITGETCGELASPQSHAFRLGYLNYTGSN